MGVHVCVYAYLGFGQQIVIRHTDQRVQISAIGFQILYCLFTILEGTGRNRAIVSWGDKNDGVDRAIDILSGGTDASSGLRGFVDEI